MHVAIIYFGTASTAGRDLCNGVMKETISKGTLLSMVLQPRRRRRQSLYGKAGLMDDVDAMLHWHPGSAQ